MKVKRVMVMLVAVALVAGMFPTPGLALVVGTASPSTFKVQADAVASGESGSCVWEIDAQGALVVKPSGGDEGMLDDGVQPWAGDARVRTVAFEGTVKTPVHAWLFKGCESLMFADLGNLDMSSTQDMSGMFYGCSSLASIDLSGLDTSHVENMSYLFALCPSLVFASVSGLDTSQVRDMSYLFYGCSSLGSLDLSAFDTNQVESANSMFGECANLSTVRVGDAWDLRSLAGTQDGADLFSGCRRLVGGAGTTYAYDQVSAASACIDTLEAPGYLTASNSVTYTAPVINLAKAKVSLSRKRFTYNGERCEPGFIVKVGGKELVRDAEYTVSYRSNVKAGTAYAVVTGIGKYKGTRRVAFTIKQAKNPLYACVSQKSVVLKRSRLQAKPLTVDNVCVQGAVGKVTYENVSKNKASKKFKMLPGGRVKVTRGLKVGTYPVSVQVHAAGNRNYKEATRIVTFNVKVRERIGDSDSALADPGDSDSSIMVPDGPGYSYDSFGLVLAQAVNGTGVFSAAHAADPLGWKASYLCRDLNGDGENELLVFAGGEAVGGKWYAFSFHSPHSPWGPAKYLGSFGGSRTVLYGGVSGGLYAIPAGTVPCDIQRVRRSGSAVSLTTASVPLAELECLVRYPVEESGYLSNFA